ncbi:MAG: Gfo/Idh/MocA family oxidoreductase, partial [Sedimenticola sp.]|nr:Gfo/Idh/MocA family oxidoreductase [Sedimenticola sp.]
MFPVISGRKIRLAIVGCGRISKNHFGSIEQHAENIELVAICDTNPQVLAEHAERFNVHAYRSMEEMLKTEQTDLVALCTPSGIHANQAVLAA